MVCRKASNKFNHAVGEAVGTTIQFFGSLYFIIAWLVGASVLMMGVYNVLTGWYAEYGPTFEGLFWIVTGLIGILIFVVSYGQAFWRDWQEKFASRRTKLDDG